MTSNKAQSIAAGIFALAAATTSAESIFDNLKQVPVDFGGFISQGLITTSDNNYLGDTDGEISDEFREAAINATFSPFNRTTVSAQAFVFTLGPTIGGFDDILLDYLFVDYNFKEWMGFRAGRIKRPFGIYNTIRDVDVARVSVLLPQSIYDSRWRDFFSYVDGVSIYGYLFNGSLEYEAYFGDVQLSSDGGLGSTVKSSFPGLTLEDINLDGPAYGFQVWWNTPIDGLRIGQAASVFEEVRILLLHPLAGNIITEINAENYLTSVQYFLNNWTFEFEHSFRFYKDIDPQSGRHTDTTQSNAWYMSAAYQLNDSLALGAYYSEYYNNMDDTSDPTEYQKEIVISARYDLTSNWLVKAEVHRVRGTALVYNDRGQNPDPKKNWWIYTVKTSYSF